MESRKFRSIKPEIRIVGVDDGVFIPHTKGKCDVFGVVFRGGYWLDGVMRTEIEVDGMDATEKIAEMITASPHYGQLRIIMLDGITYAGFNVVDTIMLFKMTNLPVIAITQKKPDFGDIRKALANLPLAEERWKVIENADRIVKVFTRKSENPIFMQVTGIDVEIARRVVKGTATRSNLPEALRVAHLIASGLTSQV